MHNTTQLVKLRRHIRILFDDAATDAMQIFDDIMNQIRLDLSNHDKYTLREVVSIIPSATLCYILSEQWSRKALTGLMEELSSK